MDNPTQIDSNQQAVSLTPSESKLASKYNAVRHGILTKVLTDEESNEAETIQSQFIHEYQPESLAEELLIETMAIAYIRRQRAINAEREFLMEILHPPVYEEHVIIEPFMKIPVDPFKGEKDVILVNAGFQSKFKQAHIDIVDKIHSRYITTCERQFYRALHELQRIQALRNGQRPASMAMDVFGDKNEG